ncbi:aminotransferase [Gracilaria domingensis]|nr:aminotransferase [Gracilaria domingensis]
MSSGRSAAAPGRPRQGAAATAATAGRQSPPRCCPASCSRRARPAARSRQRPATQRACHARRRRQRSRPCGSPKASAGRGAAGELISGGAAQGREAAGALVSSGAALGRAGCAAPGALVGGGAAGREGENVAALGARSDASASSDGARTQGCGGGGGGGERGDGGADGGAGGRRHVSVTARRGRKVAPGCGSAPAESCGAVRRGSTAVETAAKQMAEMLRAMACDARRAGAKALDCSSNACPRHHGGAKGELSCSGGVRDAESFCFARADAGAGAGTDVDTDSGEGTDKSANADTGRGRQRRWRRMLRQWRRRRCRRAAPCQRDGAARTESGGAVRRSSRGSRQRGAAWQHRSGISSQANGGGSAGNVAQRTSTGRQSALWRHVQARQSRSPSV